MSTIVIMGKKKESPRPGPKKRPTRMVRIPEQFAAILEERAERRATDLSEEVKTAVREYLERCGLLEDTSRPPALPG